MGGAKGTGGTPYFAYEMAGFARRSRSRRRAATHSARWYGSSQSGALPSISTVPAVTGSDGQRFLCKVSHAGDRPMLFLPPRDGNPAILLVGPLSPSMEQR